MSLNNNHKILVVTSIIVVAGALIYFSQIFVSNNGGQPAESQTVSIQPTEAIQSKSGINGKISLGPTCPVERFPNDPDCAPRPYLTTVVITSIGKNFDIKTVKSNASGIFRIDLVPGNYKLEAKGGEVYPRCVPTSVEVKSGNYSSVEISCDTGIR